MPGASSLAIIELKRQQLNTECLKKRYLRDLSNPMEVDEKLFISLYRLNKSTFQLVLGDIAAHFPKCSIPENIQLAAVLRYLAVGSYQGVVANDMNISMGRSTFCKILWKVMGLLEESLCPNWIKIELNAQAQRQSKSHFFQQYGIPGVIGCVDGTLIRITKPPSDHSAYFSRKGYYSLNAMMICSYKMRILAVDACRPGSCHDSFVWKMSDARRYYSEMYNDGCRNFWLLGDSGYPLQPYLMTPYKSLDYGTARHTYNQRHASARNIVERTIGVLKSRFRCLQTILPYVPSKVVTIVNVCCALHNICKHYDISLDEDVIVGMDDDNFETGEEEIEEDNSTSVAVRDNIASSLN